MKKILVAAFFALTSQYAQASVFHCTYAGVGPEIAYVFDIDTVTDNNYFINLGDDRSVGCVVFHSTPKLLACTLAKSEEYQSVATVDENSALLSLDVQQKQDSAKLRCVKQK